MPILPLELFIHPPTLFDEVSGSAGGNSLEGEWMVMHTRARAEKALVRWLMPRSVRFFLPLHKRKLRVNGRDQTSYAPLFPGYVFVHGGLDARSHALASNHVARCLPVPDQEALTSDLAGVYRLMTGEHLLTPVPEMPVGTPIEVIDGPFAGLTGQVLRVGTRARLVVEVRMLRQGVAVELGRAEVRPLTENGEAARARIALIRG